MWPTDGVQERVNGMANDTDLAEENRQLRNEVKDLRAACEHYIDQRRRVVAFLTERSPLPKSEQSEQDALKE